MIIVNKNIFFRKVKWIINFLFSFFLIFLISIQIRNHIRANESANTVLHTNQIHIGDSYDFPGNMSYSEFIRDKDSFRNLKNYYNKILNQDFYKFLEFHKGMIQIKGTYKNGLEFVSGFDEALESAELREYVNQEVNIDGEKTCISNIEGVLVGKETFEYLKLNVTIQNPFSKMKSGHPEIAFLMASYAL